MKGADTLIKYAKIVEVTKRDGTTIPGDEPVFVLRAQDVLAPIAVRFYADLVEGATGNWHSAEDIRSFAQLMSSWGKRKLPD